MRPRELLTPAALHVLLSLAEEDRHGYGIKLDVEERTSGALRLGPGTLYEAIHRMVKSGWIEEAKRPRAGRAEGIDSTVRRAKEAREERTDPRRKYYRLTREGRARLRDELERLRDIVSYPESKAILRGSETSG